MIQAMLNDSADVAIHSHGKEYEVKQILAVNRNENEGGRGDKVREVTYRRKKKWGIAAAVLALMLGLCLAVVFGLFRVQTLTIAGNTCYTADTIREAVMKDGLCKNTLYLMWKLKDEEKAREALPFLNSVEVEMLKPYHVQITVTERPQIGYFVSNGNYVYFDKDGIVVEMSGKLHEGVPLITGMKVEKAELYEKLPVKEESLYNTIVTLTKNLNKNEIVPEEIRFGTKNELILVFGQVSVNLGDDSALEDKISALGAIMDQLDGETGVLYMEGYLENSGMVTFKEEEKETDTASDEGDGTEETDENGNVTAESEDSPTYSESDGTFSTDEAGNKTYTDAAGVTTDQCESYNYTDEYGGIITDGYGYIDPYTGSYILGGQ